MSQLLGDGKAAFAEFKALYPKVAQIIRANGDLQGRIAELEWKRADIFADITLENSLLHKTLLAKLSPIDAVLRELYNAAGPDHTNALMEVDEGD